MNLTPEYLKDVVIDGKKYVLDFVTNEIVGGCVVIRRRYVRWDGKDKRYLETKVPLPAAPAAPEAPPAGASAPGKADKAPEAPEAPKTAPEPTGKKPGVLSRMFGKKKAKKQ